jgi:hypothetical protein
MAASVGLRNSGVVLCLGCELGPAHACTCGRVDPRHKNFKYLFEEVMEDDDFEWARNFRPEPKGGKMVMVADTRGTGPRGWGAGNGISPALARYRSACIFLAHVPRWKTWIWNHPKAQKYVARALALLGDKRTTERHGFSEMHAKNLSVRWRVGGEFVSVRTDSSCGQRSYQVVCVHSAAIETIVEEEASGATPQGVSTYVSCLASEVLGAPETCRERLLELDKHKEQAAYEEAAVKNSTHKAQLRDKLRAKIQFVQEQAKWPGRKSMFDSENKLARHLINKACPRRRQVIETWIACQSNGRQGKDATLTKIREALGAEGFREIIVASLPHLSSSKYKWQLDWLVKNAQIDHIFSGVIDHPANLYLDWSCPNGHFGDFRNYPGKAARYGADVMDVAAEWVLAAVDAALGVVTHSNEPV